MKYTLEQVFVAMIDADNMRWMLLFRGATEQEIKEYDESSRKQIDEMMCEEGETVEQMKKRHIEIMKKLKRNMFRMGDEPEL